MHAARVGVGGDDWSAGQRECFQAGTFANVRDIDHHAPLIEPAYHLATEVAQARVGLFQAAIANEVAGVVRE
jgi:hypothetical protein